jgi:hypothetical protein
VAGKDSIGVGSEDVVVPTVLVGLEVTGSRASSPPAHPPDKVATSIATVMTNRAFMADRSTDIGSVHVPKRPVLSS